MPRFLTEPELPGVASLKQRILAYLIDFSVTVFLALVLNLFWGHVFYPAHSISFSFHWLDEFVQLSREYANTSFLVTFVFLIVFFRDSVGSRSFGKKIIGLRVVSRTDREPVGFIRSVFRSTLAYLILFGFYVSVIPSELFIIIVVIFGLFDLVLINTQPNHRTIGDLISNTIVVQDDKPSVLK